MYIDGIEFVVLACPQSTIDGHVSQVLQNGLTVFFTGDS